MGVAVVMFAQYDSVGTQNHEKKKHNTYVKQKNRVVDPTRKVVAADTGTYRLGRKGRGGAETVPPTPPPTTELLNPGIREKNRRRQKGEENRKVVDAYRL